jgi:MarR family transcriptional regulator, organic hydroperoxide resistance regulator
MVSESNDPALDQALLGFLLGAAARKVAKFYAAAMAGQPITPSQLFLLRHLWAEDGLQPRDLALRANLDATSTTWLVDQLEKVGLLERRRGERDRRAVRVWLTGAGRDLQATLAPEVARWEAALAAALGQHHGDDDLRAFRTVLRTVIVTLPEGEDLWAEQAARWDERLAGLQRLVEDDDRKGG